MEHYIWVTIWCAGTASFTTWARALVFFAFSALVAYAAVRLTGPRALTSELPIASLPRPARILIASAVTAALAWVNWTSFIQDVMQSELDTIADGYIEQWQDGRDCTLFTPTSGGPQFSRKWAGVWTCAGDSHKLEMADVFTYSVERINARVSEYFVRHGLEPLKEVPHE